MDQLTRIQNTTASVNTEEGAEVAVSAAQVEESISVKDDVNDAAENDIEPHNVALEAEFDALPPLEVAPRPPLSLVFTLAHRESIALGPL